MRRTRTLVAAAVAGALMGCATPVPELQAPRPGVEPAETVRHGMSAEMLYRTGRYFQGLARFALAQRAYEAVLRLDPAHVDALNALGVVHSVTNRPADAERAFLLALQVAPDAARVHNNLGYHLLRSGRASEALQHLERAHELDPLDTQLAANLALARSSAPTSIAAGEATAPQAASPAAPSVAAPGAPLASQAAAEHVAASTLTAASGDEAARPLAVASARDADKAAVLAASAPVVDRDPASRAGARLEVSNGNGRTGLARRVSTELAALGAPAARLTNSKPFGAQRSAIQYVVGAEPMARDINARLPAPLPLAAVSRLGRDVRVRVLLGKDFGGAALALAGAGSQPTTSAH
jgi:hypothetical protein